MTISEISTLELTMRDVLGNLAELANTSALNFASSGFEILAIEPPPVVPRPRLTVVPTPSRRCERAVA